MEKGHLSMCYFHWLIKKLPWPFDRTGNQVGRVNRTECWEEEGNEAVAMTLLSKTDAGQNPPGKPPPRGATQIMKNGLIKM